MHRKFGPVLLFSALTAIAALPAFAIQSRIGNESFTRLMQVSGDKHAKLRIENLPFVDGAKTIDVERFQVWADNAEIKVFGDNGKVEYLPVPDTAYYKGTVQGDPSSLVFLAVQNGKVQGTIMTDREYHISTHTRISRATNRQEGTDFYIEDRGPSDEPTAPFHCDAIRGPAIRDSQGRLVPTGNALKPIANAGLATGTAMHQVPLAVDTDFALYSSGAFGSNALNVTNFIGATVGMASVIYQRDLKTILLVAYAGVHSSSGTDPYTSGPGAGTLAALYQVGDVWHNTPPSGIAHAGAILLSGKIFGGGVAWIQTLGEADFLCGSIAPGDCNAPGSDGHYAGAFAFCGDVVTNTIINPDANPNFAAPNNSNAWPLLVLAHEFGHNVESIHTHCIPMSAPNQALYGRMYVDNCYTGECFVGTAALPLESPNKGTIMSYCHLAPGNYGTTRFTFGQPTDGSGIIVTNMRTRLDDIIPQMSAITAPGSVVGGVAAAASVTATKAPNVSGADPLTFLWTITNGTINSGGTTANVNFTGTANPVTLKITVTNSRKMQVTDSIAIPVSVACSLSVSTTTPTYNSAALVGATVATTTGCAWNATTSSPFITITTGSGGSSGNIIFNLSANGTGGPRAGAINVTGASPQTINVVQSGKLTTPADMNGDAFGDLVFRNSVTGTNVLWFLSGSTVTTAPLPTVDPNFKIVGLGDFQNDGKTDILWRNSVTGANVVWLMNGASVAVSGVLPSVADLNWTVAGVGDFQGDGKADIFWRNTVTGDNSMWLMNGTAVAVFASVTSIPDTNWKIAAIGDFQNDLKADIIWRHAVTGANSVWLMNASTVAASAALPTVPDLNWQVVGVGDFQADLKADLFWRNSSSGANSIWFMNGLGLALTAATTTVPDPTWKVARVADFQGDGMADIVWRNSVAGFNSQWIMVASSFVDSSALPTVSDINFKIATTP